MTRYKFVKGLVKENNTLYQLAKKYSWELSINHNIGNHAKYHIIHNLFGIFSTNDKYALRMWMDLNGFMFQNCKIFYNKNHIIEYASILLRKE